MSLLFILAACGPTPSPPTHTPRPTLPPREAPTALPTPVDAGAVPLGGAVTITLPGSTYVHLALALNEAETVTVTGQALTDDGAGNTLDVMLDVLDGDNNLLAYDDDGGQFIDELTTSDAAITALALEPGTYTIRVNTFNGFQRGDVEVRVQTAE